MNDERRFIIEMGWFCFMVGGTSFQKFMEIEFSPWVETDPRMLEYKHLMIHAWNFGAYQQAILWNDAKSW